MRNTRSTISRREFLTAMGVTAGASVLAACQPATPAGTAAPTQAPAEEAEPAAEITGKIEVRGWEGTFEGIQAATEDFKALHPNVEITITEMDWDATHTDLLNAIAAGTGAADIYVIDFIRLPEFAAGLADLTDAIMAHKDEMFQSSIDVATYEGKIWGVAIDIEPMGLYYRSDIWEQYGIDPDSIEMWTDYVAAGEKLVADSGDTIKMCALDADGAISLLEEMWLQESINYFNEEDTAVVIGDPKAIEIVQLVKDMWDSDICWKDLGGDAEISSDKAGTTASQPIGPAWWMLIHTGQEPELSGKWAIMRLPAVTAGGRRSSYQWPSLHVIPAQSQNKDAAWALVEFSNFRPEAARAYFELTHCPTGTRALYDEIGDQPDEYYGGQKTLQFWAEVADDAPPLHFGTGFYEAHDIMSRHLQEILAGNATAEQGVQAAADEIREALGKE